MSRSKRKTPKCGNTTARSEKEDKILSHRKTRRVTAQAMLKPEDEATLPLRHRDTTNTFKLDKDGKKMFDPAEFPELMRK